MKNSSCGVLNGIAGMSGAAARTTSIMRISGIRTTPHRNCRATRDFSTAPRRLGVRLDGRRGEVCNKPSWRYAISFSADVKNEMAGLLPARPCCQLSELLGIYFGSRGRLLRRTGDGRAAYFSLLRNAIARKVVRLGRAVGHMEAKYQAVKTKKRMTFFIELALPSGLEGAFTQSAAAAMPD